MKVQKAMAKKPLYLKNNDTLSYAVKVFSKNDISGCPVIFKKRVVGIITRTDIINAIDPHSRIIKDIDLIALVDATLKDSRFENMKRSIKKTMAMPIDRFMNKKVVCIEENDDVYNAARLMNKRDISILPVVRDRKLVGVLTRTDIIRILHRLG